MADALHDGRTFRADLGLRHLPAELGLPHRAVDRAVAGGRLRPADPDAYAKAWLTASLHTRAATGSMLTAAWAPPSVPVLTES
ncbi:hypothetical protein [Streptomyces sp. PA5.6]|uniref:hypothetical protein n=1 Tax=Streptomyces sp. PA5.6 TaxID=3035651 RepID=UPI0039048703